LRSPSTSMAWCVDAVAMVMNLLVTRFGRTHGRTARAAAM